MTDLYDRMYDSRLPGKCRPKLCDVPELVKALKMAVYQHQRLRPPEPVGADLLPKRLFHHWEDGQRALETVLASVDELGDKAYSVERVKGETNGD